MPNKILFQPKEGTSGFFKIEVPEEPNSNSPAYHPIDNTFYEKALESCKSNGVEIVNPEVIVNPDTKYFIEHELKPGDIFDLPIGYEFKEEEKCLIWCGLTKCLPINGGGCRTTKVIRLVKRSGIKTTNKRSAREYEKQGLTHKEYDAIHSYIRAHNPKTGICSKCGTQVAKKYEWALKKGRKYSRDISDYEELCRSCHKKSDITNEFRELRSNLVRDGILSGKYKSNLPKLNHDKRLQLLIKFIEDNPDIFHKVVNDIFLEIESSSTIKEKEPEPEESQAEVCQKVIDDIMKFQTYNKTTEHSLNHLLKNFTIQRKKQ